MASEIAKLFVTIDADMKGFQGKLQKLGPQMKKIGMGATVMGGIIVGGFGLAVKGAANFESGMREVNTMMGLGQNEFKAFSDDVLKMAKNLGVDAIASTKALYQAISAGVPKDNVLSFLEIATKAAIGGVTDTETAVDGLTTIINAFKLPMSEAQKVADVMFTTVKGGKTTFAELSASMAQAMPTAAALGVSYEEVLATVATLTKQGVPTAQAFTQIRASMVSLMKPTKDMETLMDKAGYQTGRSMLEALGYAGTLEALTIAAEGNDSVLGKAFGSVEALGAVFGTTGENASMMAADLDAVKNATDGAGAATEAFNEIERGSARQLERTQQRIKAMAISIGGTLLPALTPLIDKISEVIGKVSDWMEANPELMKTIVKVVAVVGALLLVIGPLLIFLPGLIAALPLLGAAFAVLTGPIGLVIAAVVALVAAGIWLWKNWDKVAAAFTVIWSGIKNAFQVVVVSIIKGINWIIVGLNRIKFKLPAWLGGQSFGINIAPLTIPAFDKGGVFTKPTVGIIAEKRPEAVMPLSKLGGMGTVVSINVEGSVVTEQELLTFIKEGLLIDKGSNVTLGL